MKWNQAIITGVPAEKVQNNPFVMALIKAILTLTVAQLANQLHILQKKTKIFIFAVVKKLAMVFFVTALTILNYLKIYYFVKSTVKQKKLMIFTEYSLTRHNVYCAKYTTWAKPTGSALLIA